MVKPDRARDYYNDLGLDSSADAATIKKSYRALAQQVHPDKNPAPEATAMFQNISTAYEVLKDPTTRRQYDEIRAANPKTSNSRYQSGGNQRGNPWSNVGTQYPPPPKPPTARTAGPPPPSAGAQRYKNFETPKQSANATAQEGADARRSTYEAWEHMRNNRAPPQPPPSPGRPENSRFKPPPPKAARPVYEEFRTNYNSPRSSSPGRRAQSSSASNRKGFVPTTPGGDESPAPKGAYFTGRKSSQAPPPPPRNNPAPSATSTSIPVDPLKQFRNHPDVQFEPRQSTPYATQGGEKFDPLGATLDPSDTINRSKSTHEHRNKSQQQMPRAGSDSNLNSPQYSQSFGQTPPKPTYAMPMPDSDSSSSDSGPTMRTRTFANARGVRKQPGVHPDAAPSQTANSAATDQQTNGEPSMYEQFRIPLSQQSQTSEKRVFSNGKLPTVSEHMSPKDDCFVPPASTSSRTVDFDAFRNLYRSSFAATKSPSGAASSSLYPLEEATRSVVDYMINKRSPGGSFDTSSPRERDKSSSRPTKDAWSTWRESAQDGSPFKKQRSTSHNTQKPFGCGPFPHFWNSADNINPNANHVNGASRFSIPVHEKQSHRNDSTSSENINMKFSSDDWTGKFEGSNFFQPEQKGANMNRNTRSRTQSGSGTRSRGRSPIKPRPSDPHYMQHPAEPETTVESPGGTKFSQEEWAKTFKNPIFVAPPPPSSAATQRPTRRPVRKQNGPAATAVDDSDSSSNQQPAFAERTTSNQATASPDAMDIDTPPVMNPTIPRIVPNGKATSSKGVASPPTATAELNVEFEDLKVKDIISSLALPTPPAAPSIPSQSLEMEPYHQYMEAFGQYMMSWDLFDNRMLLHFVARKNINNKLGDARWIDDKAFDAYRMGIRDDRVVMTHMNSAHEAHAKAMKDCAIVREKMREFGESPRKKTL